MNNKKYKKKKIYKTKYKTWEKCERPSIWELQHRNAPGCTQFHLYTNNIERIYVYIFSIFIYVSLSLMYRTVTYFSISFSVFVSPSGVSTRKNININIFINIILFNNIKLNRILLSYIKNNIK